MPNVSIEISARDNFSDAITTMRNANNGFNKDLTGTMEKLDGLNKTKYQLKVDTDKAKGALKEAEKQFQRTGDAADKMARDTAAANFDNAKRNLNLVSQSARQAEKDILSMTGAVEKSDNRASTVKTKETGASGLFSRLAGAGLTKMVGDSLTGVAQTYISSAFNNETGTAVSSVLGGITSGAAIGSVIPGVGTAIGAVAGAATGAVTAATKTFADKDGAFKSVVQNEYNTIKSAEASSLQSGNSTASEREGDLRAFTSLLDGNTKKAGQFQSALIEIGRTPPFSYGTVAQLSKEMLGLGDSTDTATKKINDLAEVASAENWSQGTVESVNEILNQTLASGQVSSRVLKTLDRYGLHAEEAISQAFHIKESDVSKKINKLNPTSVVNAIYNYMGKKFAGASKTMASTYEGLKGIASSYEDDLNAKMGEGHNEEAKKGYQSEIKTMSGKVGKSLQEAYSMEGKFKAQLENSQKELLDNAYTSVTTGKVTGKFSSDHKTELKKLADDYKQSMAKASKGDQEAEEKAARDIEKAKIIAQNEYKATEGYQLELKGDKGLAEAIKNDTSLKQEYWDAGYEMGEQFSQGRVSGVQKSLDAGLHPLPIQRTPGIGLGMDPKFARNKVPGLSSRATGIFRVPYNDYPALLHEDERVLTGAEARSQKSSGGVSVEINGPVTVRKESDIDAIASRLYQKLQKARAVTP